jgi:hypothetical protein
LDKFKEQSEAPLKKIVHTLLCEALDKNADKKLKTPLITAEDAINNKQLGAIKKIFNGLPDNSNNVSGYDYTGMMQAIPTAASNPSSLGTTT